jgi:transglutaminase-like putative cysteine protease
MQVITFVCMKIILLFIVVFLSSCASGRFSMDQEEQSALTEGMPLHWSKEDFVILSDSLQISFNNGLLGNSATVHGVKWILVNEIRGKRLDPFVFPSSAYTQEAPTLSLSWFSPEKDEGGFYTTKFFGQEDNFYQGVYATGSTLYLAKLPIYERGMLIRYSYEYEQTHPEFLSQFELQSELPTLHSYVKFDYPKSTQPKFKIERFDSLKVEQKLDSGMSRKTVEWTFGNREPFQPLGTYRPEEWTTALHLSLPPQGDIAMDWKSLGDFYLSKMDNELPKDSEQLSRIAKGKTPQEILAYMRSHLRYHADTRGENAVFPKNSEVTLEMGYGDCKGFSLLLMQLLRIAGYKAHLVLATASSGASQALESYPTLGLFDHMIVALEDSSGKLLFLDPTNSWPRWDETAWVVVGKKCLVLEKGKSRYIQIPFPETARSEVKSENHITDLDSTLQVQGKMEFIGLPSYPMHMTLSTKNESERSAQLREILRDDYNLDISSVRITADSVGYFAIEYSAPLGNSWLKLAHPGLRLDRPGISLLGNLRQSGPGWIRIFPMTQTDRWVFPQAKPPVLDQPELQNQLGTAKWSIEGSSVIRSFVRNPISKVTIDDARDQLLALQGNTAWVE